MVKEAIEQRLAKALACLDFLTGILSQNKVGLTPKEIDGLVFILTDILEAFEEASVFVHHSQEVL